MTTPAVVLAAPVAPPLASPAAPPPAPTAELAMAPERVARGLRAARARTGLSEADVVSILDRQGVPLTVESLRRAERTGGIALALAACLADIYGTTTDGLAGRRIHRRRPSLDGFPADA
jgi:hypothetical protein